MEFKINDAIYAYEVYGQGQPLVALHGFTGSMKTWHSLIDHWKESFRVILIDLPGHGKTTVSSPRSIEQCCEELKALLKYLNLTAVHLLGYSMGGRTALSFALYYPEMIHTLILESSSPGLKSEDEQLWRKEQDEQLASRLESEGIISFVDYWESIPLFETQQRLPKNIQQVIRNERLEQSPSGLAGSLRKMGTGSQPSWWKSLSHFQQPVLLLVGQLDEKFVLINQQMKTKLKNSQLKIVSNVGHAIHVEQSENFGKMVEEFIVNNNQTNI